jgi:hypothetical protein
MNTLIHPRRFPSFYAPSRSALSDLEIAKRAPSVFSPSPSAKVSSRYAFVPTANIVSHLRTAGWVPVEAAEGRVRLSDRRGFQRHLLRFQRIDTIAAKGDFAPELVLLNSHDGTSAYQLHAGLFRFICANGMIVGDSMITRIRVRHSGFTGQEVTEASLAILAQVGRITDSVAKFRSRQVTQDEAMALATAAWHLRFPEAAKAPIQPATLLEARRHEDQGNDLWLTINRVQENCLRGGQRDLGRNPLTGHRMRRTRAVTALDQNVRLNKALWDLAHRLCAGEPLVTTE